MQIITRPSFALQGVLRVPSDKSISHRALILAALAQGETTLNDLLMSEDCLATLQILKACGVQCLSNSSNSLVIKGRGLKGLIAPKQDLDCKNSGTSMRLLAGVLAGQSFSSTLQGDLSLQQRPMQRIALPLQKMGAKLQLTAQKTAPLHIKPVAALTGITYETPIPSAQVKSCLLLAGLYAKGKTEIIESIPTRNHTEKMLEAFGYPITFSPGKAALVGGAPLRAHTVCVPADLSSAAFYMVAACITPGASLTLLQVGVNPTRTGIIELLQSMGANITISEPSLMGTEPIANIHVTFSALQGVVLAKNAVISAIDELPVLMIAAACATGKTVLRGAKELRVKESDRISAMVIGLRQLGIEVEELEDGMIVTGGQLQGAVVDSFHDHRIAMAFAIAGGVAKNPITIKNTENIATSFPNFVTLSSQIGINLTELL